MNKPTYSLMMFLCLLTACAKISTTPSPTTNSATTTIPVPVTTPAINRLDVLDFAENFGELSYEAQKKELQQNSQSRNDLNSRIKVAMIYALPSSKLRDTNKAQALLEDLAKDKNLEGDRKILMLILRDYIAENNKFNNKARDEQKRADALQQKLDELKNIEKMMLEREQGTRK
jgi:hypothetical protein